MHFVFLRRCEPKLSGDSAISAASPSTVLAAERQERILVLHLLVKGDALCSFPPRFPLASLRAAVIEFRSFTEDIRVSPEWLTSCQDV